MTTAKSCCFIQDKDKDINNKKKNSKEKSDLRFPGILDRQAVFLQGLLHFNEEDLVLKPLKK